MKRVAPCDIVIAGAGNLGKLLFDCLEGDTRWRVVGFLDDSPSNPLDNLGQPIYQPDEYDPRTCRSAFVAVGAPLARESFIARLASLELSWMTYIDRRSHVSSRADLGEGSIVFPFASIGPGTSVGRFSYIGAYASIGTKAVLGDYGSMMPRSSAGSCCVGAKCTIGLNSAILDGAVVEDEVVLAPYTWVRKHIPARSFVSGIPARIRPLP